MNRANIVRNAICGSFAAFGWLAFMGGVVLGEYWASRGSTLPDPAHDLTYFYKGATAVGYISSIQGLAVQGLMAGIGLFFLAILIRPKSNIRTTTAFLAMRWDWDPDDPQKVSRWGAVAGGLAAFALLGWIWWLAR